MSEIDVKTMYSLYFSSLIHSILKLKWHWILNFYPWSLIFFAFLLIPFDFKEPKKLYTVYRVYIERIQCTVLYTNKKLKKKLENFFLSSTLRTHKETQILTLVNWETLFCHLKDMIKKPLNIASNHIKRVLNISHYFSTLLTL